LADACSAKIVKRRWCLDDGFGRLVHSSVVGCCGFARSGRRHGSALPDRAQPDTTREAGLNDADPETLGVFPMGAVSNTSMALFAAWIVKGNPGPFGLRDFCRRD
jgi:hypothetical protein